MKFDNSYFHSKNDAPETENLKIKDIGYCCSDCPSLIEILSIILIKLTNIKEIKNY